MSQRGGQVLRIAGTYVGTVVGAGFASGQEVLRFFTAYGDRGTLGLLVVMVLLAFFGAALMRIGAAVRAESHREVMQAVGGRLLGTFSDWLTTGFLFAGTAVMISGSSALLREQFGWPGWLGGAVMTLAVIVTVLFRLRGVIAVTASIAPFLIASVLLLSLGTILQGNPLSLLVPSWTPEAGETGVSGAAPFWPLAALLYASFNLVLATPVLAPLGAVVRDRSAMTTGAVLGGVLLGSGALAIHLALASRLPASAEYEVPMLFLARELHPAFGLVYAVILWAEVYTTAVASLFGAAAGVRSPRGAGYGRAVVVIGLAAFAVSFFGFADLVQRVYPLAGYLGLVILAAVGYSLIVGLPRTRGGRW